MSEWFTPADRHNVTDYQQINTVTAELVSREMSELSSPADRNSVTDYQQINTVTAKHVTRKMSECVSMIMSKITLADMARIPGDY